jgi:AcrR family transcriptional regulator
MATKERILDEALTLFSTNGYDGVSIKDIANAVGIKDSSIYKHFKSKYQIFETIIQQMANRMEEIHQKLQVPDARSQNVSLCFGNMTAETLVEISKKLFLFYLKDSVVGRLRRLLTVEQYRNSEIAETYRKIYIDSAIDYQTEVFRQMIVAGTFVEGDPYLMAIHFHSPILLLLSKYDNMIEKEEEALKILEKHVNHFGRMYSV